MSANHVTESQLTSGLNFKASADTEEQYLFNFLLHILTTHPRTIPNLIGMHVQVTSPTSCH